MKPTVTMLLEDWERAKDDHTKTAMRIARIEDDLHLVFGCSLAKLQERAEIARAKRKPSFLD